MFWPGPRRIHLKSVNLSQIALEVKLIDYSGLLSLHEDAIGIRHSIDRLFLLEQPNKRKVLYVRVSTLM